MLLLLRLFVAVLLTFHLVNENDIPLEGTFQGYDDLGNEKIDLETKSMTGNSASLELPVSVRGRFTIAVREAGWHFANNDGVLRIWK